MNIIILLSLVFSCSVNATLPSELENKKRPIICNWWRSISASFNDIITGNTFHGRSYANCHLQHMTDNNNLYTALEVFIDKKADEVLSLVYIHVMITAGNLYKDLNNADLPVPYWLKGHKDIIQDLMTMTRLSTVESSTDKDDTIKNLNNRVKYLYYQLQTLFEHNKDIFNPNHVINKMINNKTEKLLSESRTNKKIFAPEYIAQQNKLLDELFIEYLVDAIDNPKGRPYFPALEAFVNWCKNNPNAEIKLLLLDSDKWRKHRSPQNIIENNNNNEYLFSYLQCHSEVKWHNADDALRMDETNTITTNILSSDIVKDLVKNFKTVRSLVSAYKKGLIDKNKTFNKKEEDTSKDNINEYIHDQTAKNTNKSFLGKLASNMAQLFTTIKSKFPSRLTDNDQCKKAMTIWVNYLHKNALKLNFNDEISGYKLIIRILSDIDKKTQDHDIKIDDALVEIIKHRFDSKELDKAFTMLTGLYRNVNISNASYCYKPLETAFIDKSSYSDHLQQEKIGDAMQGAEEQSEWLHMPESDYLLQKVATSQQTDYYHNCTDQTEQLNLHQDWQVEAEEPSQDKTTSKTSLNYIYNAPSFAKKIVSASMVICLASNYIRGKYFNKTLEYKPSEEKTEYNSAESNNNSITRCRVATDIYNNYEEGDKVVMLPHSYSVLCEEENLHDLEHILINCVHMEVYFRAENSSGLRIIDIACMKGHTGIIQLFLDRNIDINRYNSIGLTPLHYACTYNKTEAICLLLKNKANIYANDGYDNCMPFFAACTINNCDVIKALLEENRSLLKVKDKDGNEMINLAYDASDYKMLSILLENGADITSLYRKDRTFLFDDIVSEILPTDNEVTFDPDNKKLLHNILNASKRAEDIDELTAISESIFSWYYSRNAKTNDLNILFYNICIKDSNSIPSLLDISYLNIATKPATSCSETLLPKSLQKQLAILRHNSSDFLLRDLLKRMATYLKDRYAPGKLSKFFITK